MRRGAVGASGEDESDRIGRGRRAVLEGEQDLVAGAGEVGGRVGPGPEV